MIVYLDPMFGEAKENIERARAQLGKALGFRGTITDIRAKRNRIIANIQINLKWDIPDIEKPGYLRDWLPTRVYHFKVNYS